LVAGDVLAAQLWSTTAQQAIDGSKDLQFVFPRERFALYVDNSAILRESKRKELAHEFVNYLLRPKVAADIAIQARTACANGEARKLLPPEIRDNPTLFPPAEVMARGEWAGTPSLAIQRLRDRLWTEIKSS
jgi:spermidine/putrescine transport system substrate-binding protein